MAEIELGPLSERLDDDEVQEVAGQLDRAGLNYDVRRDYTSKRVAGRLSEDATTEFLDRLDAHDVAAEIYLPIEFDTVIACDWPGPWRGTGVLSKSTARVGTWTSTKTYSPLTIRVWRPWWNRSASNPPLTTLRRARPLTA